MRYAKTKKIKEGTLPSDKLMSAVGSQPLWNALSDSIVSRSSENVSPKSKFFAKKGGMAGKSGCHLELFF